VVDREKERVKPLLCLRAAGGPVDVTERLFEPPRLGDDRIASEQLAESAPLTFGQPLGRLEQPVSGLVELSAPANVLTAAPGSLRTFRPGGALTLAADSIQCGVR